MHSEERLKAPLYRCFLMFQESSSRPLVFFQEVILLRGSDRPWIRKTIYGANRVTVFLPWGRKGWRHYGLYLLPSLQRAIRHFRCLKAAAHHKMRRPRGTRTASVGEFLIKPLKGGNYVDLVMIRVKDRRIVLVLEGKDFVEPVGSGYRKKDFAQLKNSISRAFHYNRGLGNSFPMMYGLLVGSTKVYLRCHSYTNAGEGQ